MVLLREYRDFPSLSKLLVEMFVTVESCSIHLLLGHMGLYIVKDMINKSTNQPASSLQRTSDILQHHSYLRLIFEGIIHEKHHAHNIKSRPTFAMESNLLNRWYRLYTLAKAIMSVEFRAGERSAIFLRLPVFSTLLSSLLNRHMHLLDPSPHR